MYQQGDVSSHRKMFNVHGEYAVSYLTFYINTIKDVILLQFKTCHGLFHLGGMRNGRPEVI